MIGALGLPGPFGSFGSRPAVAAEIAAFDRQVHLTAREQSVGGFVEELFAQIDVPVIIEPGLEGRVSGDFVKSAGEVFDDIATTFQVDVYYDGAVAHVYRSRELVRSVLPMGDAAARRVVASADDLGLTDARNSLRVAAGGGLLMSGAPRFVAQVEELVAAVGEGPVRRSTAPAIAASDAPPASATMRVFRLKYAWADDVTLAVGGQSLIVPGVVSVLRTLVAPGAIDVGTRAERRRLESTVPGLRGEGLQASARVNEGVAADRPPPRGDNSETRIVADGRLNAVIVRDVPERMAMYEELIAALDVRPRMLEIEATIIDLDTDRLRELGINWRVQGERGEALVGDGSGRDRLLRPGDPSAITPSGEGGIVSLVLGGQPRFISRIRALESQGAARIVSKPHVITLSDVEAVLDTSSTFFVRVEGEEEVDLFNVSVGTTLRVTPHVFEDGGRQHIKLLVSIEDGSATDREVDSIPIVERSTVNTQALIETGQSLLVGGLVREVRASTVDKVPLLGDIPGLGLLFRSNGTSSNRVERMFLITPRLIDSSNDVRTLTAPILEGSESDIVTSGRYRGAELERALALRDRARPLEESLPPAGADVRLYDGVPAPLEPPGGGRRAPEETVAEPPRPSLRERLLGPSDDGADGQVATLPPASDDGWSVVPGTAPSAVPALRAVSNARRDVARQPDARAPLDDGWQEVR